MPETHKGSCFCGAVTIEVTGTPVEIGYCHCSSCRSYSGAPLVSFTLWKDENVRITKGAEFVGGYNKTGKSLRRFCKKCGGRIMTEHPGFGFTDVSAELLRSVAFKPTVHLNYAEAVLPIKDGLVKLRDFPAHAGGSGEVVPE
jgi:hypothetical protein